MATAKAPQSTFETKLSSQEGRDISMATNTIGYSNVWKKFSQRGLLAGVAGLALAATVAVVVQTGIGSSGPAKSAAERTLITRSAAPAAEPQHLTIYVVATEEQAQALEQNIAEVAAIRLASGEEPLSSVVSVVEPGKDPGAVPAIMDTELIRAQDGLPFTLVDLR
jgi:hypothetical protein